jgi:hypothetical protein
VRVADANGVVFVRGKANRALVPLGTWNTVTLKQLLFNSGIILENTV